MNPLMVLDDPVPVVILSGKLMSGKSTALSYLQEVTSDWSKTALADELKDDICRLTGVSRQYLEEHKDLFRPLLQYYGTDIMRKLYGEYYWVNRAKKRIISRGMQAAVIDDVRFSSELFGFGECSPYLVRLEISTEEQVARYVNKFGKHPDMSIFYHESETALDDIPEEVWDCRVQVDGLTTLQVRDTIFASMKHDNFNYKNPLDMPLSFEYITK